MRTPNPITATYSRSAVLSTIIHAALLLALLGVIHGSHPIAPYRLPGTAQGTTLLTYYSPGSLAPSISKTPLKTATDRTPAPPIHAAPAPPKAQETAALSAAAGTGSSTDSGLGEGDIRIALQTYNPPPKPVLSALAHGTRGDVILNAVIDEHGKITDLTLIKGLGPSIDNEVIATVKQWSYSPATKNGIPIPSEQELHFHYERS